MRFVSACSREINLCSRFYNLLWHLSTAAVKTALAKKYSTPAPPKRVIDASVYKQAAIIGNAPKVRDCALVLSPSKRAPLTRLLYLRPTQLRIARNRQLFVSHAQAVVAEQAQWREYAQELETEYRGLTQKMVLPPLRCIG
jgi:hypothetical protein